MSDKDDYLVVQLQVMVNIGPKSINTWTEERCEEKCREVVAAINTDYTISTNHDWWVV